MQHSLLQPDVQIALVKCAVSVAQEIFNFLQKVLA